MRKKNYSKQKQTRLYVQQSVDLMNFLLQKMGGMSRTSVKSLLSHRQIQVNGRIETQYNYLLKEGDCVVISTSVANTELVHPKLKVIFEDDDLLVVEKKTGILTAPIKTDSRESTVLSVLKTYVRKSNPKNNVFVVHRLDRETSGLLVFAKSRELQEFMRDNWTQIATERAYTALVEGVVDREKDTIVSWLTENPTTMRVYSSFTDNGGKKSITHYRKLKTSNEYSLIELRLETGRTNQIRVQMASVGHPVVGDRKYGLGVSTIMNRLALHAHLLVFEHPVSHQKMKFKLPIPKEFMKVFR